MYRASRNLERGLDWVERIADTCWNDLVANCADADRIGHCVLEKAASFSPQCQTAVAGIRQVLQGLASLRGLPAYTSDDKDIGRVIEVVRGPDGKVQAIHVEVGRFLGLGNRVVKIDGDAFEQLADRVRLHLAADAVRALPDVKKQ